MDAIILAGGLGTRLREVTKNQYPKPLAVVSGRPFISYVVQQLIDANIDRIVVAVSHLGHQIEEYLLNAFPEQEFVFSRESDPLGTGGAIALALQHVTSENFLVLNGDSFFDISIHNFIENSSEDCDVSICAAYVSDVFRYGTLNIDSGNAVVGFNEKGGQGEGWINSGIYKISSTTVFSKRDDASIKFSFEEFLSSPDVVKTAVKLNGYFVDIGIPEDYEKGQDGMRKVGENHNV